MNKKPKLFNVRFEKITIKNFKNVKNGVVDLGKTYNDDFSFKPSVLGVYGQNGSGKTTLIQVIEAIKILLMGYSLPKDIIDLVSVDTDDCEIDVDFIITDNATEKFNVNYKVQLEKIDALMSNTVNVVNGNNVVQKVVVKSETLSASFSDLQNSKSHKTTIIDCNQNDNDNVFLPKTKLKSLTNDSKEAKNKLLINKKMSYENSKSFIFSIETLNVFRQSKQDDFAMTVIENLINFANGNLFVVSTKNSGLINLNAALPFNFILKDKNHTSIGNIVIDLSNVSKIPTELYDLVLRSINSMNMVLSKLIPQMRVELEKIGRENDENGFEFVRVQLFSIRNGKKISMANESEGIKKIVSFLQLLVVMFNNPSTTVAIDELDSGIFEYLLGEILRIISKSAKGQLIFTSHNLRALETIDKKFVCFTTTNENNRYIKMAYVGKNNNLRDFYFHELLLGGQKEQLYEPTNNGSITLAFNEAGDIN